MEFCAAKTTKQNKEYVWILWSSWIVSWRSDIVIKKLIVTLKNKNIKKNSDIFSDILFKELNKSLEICKFPSCLKITNVTFVYQKWNRSDKGNYCPVSILRNFSNIFERCLCKEISTIFDDILSKYLCGFRKEHSAQHCLLALIEK